MYKTVKPLVDVIGALILFFFVWPIILFCGICIKLEDPSGPVFFLQKRVGKEEKIFHIYKLRTMNSNTDRKGTLLSDSERMLHCGKWIRKLSLDELPQIINILKGEMSFIGPRPLLLEYLAFYTEKEIKRHSVKPGISGWAQINGRNSLTWEERFALDLDYIDQLSFKLDTKIVLLTIKKVLSGSDVIEDESEELADFDVYRMNQMRRSK